MFVWSQKNEKNLNFVNIYKKEILKSNFFNKNLKNSRRDKRKAASDLEAVFHMCSVKKVFLEILQNFFKKRLWHKCFPVNFAKFLRTPFSIEHLWWLFLKTHCLLGHLWLAKKTNSMELNLLRGQWVHPKNYNYLNPTQVSYLNCVALFFRNMRL